MPLLDEHGERIRGKANKEAARRALARINLAVELGPPSTAASGEWTVARVCDVYLQDLHRSATPDWAKQVEKWLNDLCRYCGALKVCEFQKKHLREWLQQHLTWNHNSQRNVIATVLAAFNYCCHFDNLDANPVAGFEKPTATPRVTAFTPEEEDAIYEATDEAHGLYIRSCILTGARPYSELAKVTADHVVETEHGMYYLLKARTHDGRSGHKTGKRTGKDRRIMLCDEMEDITRRLMLKAPRESGIPLFLSTRGETWQKSNGVQRFCQLRKRLRLPADRCMYTCRHTFAKRHLSGYYTGRPITIEVLAGLMGNTPQTCWRHYACWADQYNDPLWAALGKHKRARVAG